MNDRLPEECLAPPWWAVARVDFKRPSWKAADVCWQLCGPAPEDHTLQELPDQCGRCNGKVTLGLEAIMAPPELQGAMLGGAKGVLVFKFYLGRCSKCGSVLWRPWENKGATSEGRE